MVFRAAFFDRDNTLLHGSPAIRQERNDKIASWSGRPFSLTSQEMMEIFLQDYPKAGLKSVEEEIAFQQRYWQRLLHCAGVTDCLVERAEELHQLTWLKGYELFPETMEVLEWFRTHGFRMGVISDTSPSLPLTLEAAGIGGYFDCAVCSDLAGFMKPDPAIYQVALNDLGVAAGESLYVDDYDVEADGARALGMTAFHIDRNQPGDGQWRIQSLWEIVRFVENHA